MCNKKYFFLALFAAGISSFFLSCKENDEYKGIVIVSMIDTLDIKTPVPNCELVFGVDSFAADVKRVAYTDNAGRYEGIWKKDVFLPVVATKEIDSVMYTGSSVLRVKVQGAEPVEILFKQSTR
ncbi:MAG: hypothetical protein LBH82_02405 [Bacteroidales bacterium]|jgi:hypothetical protein|nr:hypothetical protein [Bacteroidales bacterium]